MNLAERSRFKCWNGSQQRKLNKTKTVAVLQHRHGERLRNLNPFMKKGNQVHAKNSPAVASAQSKTQAEKSAPKARPRARAGRRTVRVLMPQFMRIALRAALKRTGKSRDEFFEDAIRKQIERFDSGATHAVKGGAR